MVGLSLLPLPRREDRGDEGSMLVELLAAVVLLAIVLGVTVAMFVGGMGTSRGAAARTDDAAAGRAALDQMSRALRAAVPTDGLSVSTSVGSPAFSAAGPTSVTFQTNLYTLAPGGTSPALYAAPSVVTYWVSSDPAACPGGGCLLESVTPPGGVARVRVLARNVVLVPRSCNGAAPVPRAFCYYSPTDPLTANDTTSSTLTVDASGNLVSYALATVGSVEMWVSVRSPSTPPVAASTVQNRVTVVSNQSISTATS